ncbi:MAG: GNAT family acetyltransferase [Bacteroidia bacterium]
MKLREALLSDITGVLALQEKYLITNIHPTEIAGGFVTTPFTESQLSEVINLHGLFIAENNNTIIGYAFAASWNYFSQWKIFPYMTSRFPQIKFENKLLDVNKSFQYGPICIEKEYRGTGLLQQLFEVMRKSMQTIYPIGVTFINKINTRSYDAHTRKLKMEVIDEFNFNGNGYYGLAFRTDQSVLV